jgi:FkbM family methyltransferase
LKKFKFLDIGANIGIYSLYAASRNINVASFEPESSNFYQLNLNILDNSFQNLIKAYPFCAGIKLDVGSLDLDTLKIGGSGHISRHKYCKNAKKKNNKLFSQGAAVISLDYFIKITSFVPNCIKIDNDGNEDQVVSGMKKILQHKSLRSILIEIDSTNKSHLTAIKEITSKNLKLLKTQVVIKLSQTIFF